MRGFPEVHQKELPRIQFVTAGIRHERALQWVPQTGGGGGKVFVGATGNVWATVTYLARRGDSPSPFSRTDSRIPYQGQVR